MKNLLSSAPLLVTFAAVATIAIIALLNLRVIAPESLAIGAGFVTCLGLSAMMARDLGSEPSY